MSAPKPPADEPARITRLTWVIVRRELIEVAPDVLVADHHAAAHARRVRARRGRRRCSTARTRSWRPSGFLSSRDRRSRCCTARCSRRTAPCPSRRGCATAPAGVALKHAPPPSRYTTRSPLVPRLTPTPVAESSMQTSPATGTYCHVAGVVPSSRRAAAPVARAAAARRDRHQRDGRELPHGARVSSSRRRIWARKPSRLTLNSTSRSDSGLGRTRPRVGPRPEVTGDNGACPTSHTWRPLSTPT